MKKNKISFARFLVIALSIAALPILNSCYASPEACYMQMSSTRDAEAYSVPEMNTEEYKYIEENQFLAAREQPLSTFGADADTASYTNARRMIMDEKRLPPRDAVRAEEFLNYFTYDYPKPQGDEIFNVTFEMGPCPWQKEHQLLLIGVQGKEIAREKLPPSNFVFLIDNSGSMSDQMPLLREAMSMLAAELRPVDKISMVTYGGGVSTLLDSASGSDKKAIMKIINKLESGGYTPGSAGIQTAYKLARKNFIPNGNNRIVLVTDGDFNVGVSSESELVEMVEKERNSFIYLTAVGMGYGNYKDNKLKMLANKGNGNYIYIDNPREARHALVNEMTGRMHTLARDVKFQLEFNPEKIHSYRLIGYELRKMESRDFKDDTKDSGEVGVGHQVTALYELVMADGKNTAQAAEPLKFQKTESTGEHGLLTFKLRYQLPEGDAPARQLDWELNEIPKSTANWQWAGAVAEFALLLRNSPNKGNASYLDILSRTEEYRSGPRAEFREIVKAAEKLRPAAAGEL